MNTRIIGVLSLSVIVLCIVWILVGLQSRTGGYNQVTTVDQCVEYQTSNQTNHAVNFVLSFFFTVLITCFFVSLYLYCRDSFSLLAAVAAIFLPAYLVLAISIYSLQVTVMPQLVEMYRVPECREAVSLFLSQFLPGSDRAAAGFLYIPYAFLGIPATIFGGILMKDSKMLKWAGVFLLMGGIGLLSGLLNILTEHVILRALNTIGGLALLLSLIPTSIAFLRGGRKEREQLKPAA